MEIWRYPQNFILGRAIEEIIYQISALICGNNSDRAAVTSLLGVSFSQDFVL